MAKLLCISSLIVLVAALDLGLCQVIKPGDCPALPTQTQFNPAQFISSRWYITSRYQSAFEENTRCSLIDIKPSKKGSLTMSFKAISTLDGSVSTTSGNAYFDYGQLSKFLVSMPVNSWNTTNELHFWIISTDYKNYAIAWSCDVLCPGWNRQQLWVLSRKTTLDPTVWSQVSNTYFTNGPFQASYLLPVDQNNCPTITVLKNINSEDDLLFLPQNQN